MEKKLSSFLLFAFSSSEQAPDDVDETTLFETAPPYRPQRFVQTAWTPPPASFWTTPSKDSMEGQHTAAAIAAEKRSKLLNKVQQLHDGVLYWPPAHEELDRPRTPTKVLINTRNVSDAIDAPGALTMSVSHVLAIRQQKNSDRAATPQKMPLLATYRQPPRYHVGVPNSRLYRDDPSPLAQAARTAARKKLLERTNAAREKKLGETLRLADVSGGMDEGGDSGEMGGDQKGTDDSTAENAASATSSTLPPIGVAPPKTSLRKASPQRMRNGGGSSSRIDSALTRASREHAKWLSSEMEWLKTLRTASTGGNSKRNRPKRMMSSI